MYFRVLCLKAFNPIMQGLAQCVHSGIALLYDSHTHRPVSVGAYEAVVRSRLLYYFSQFLEKVYAASDIEPYTFYILSGSQF